MAVVEHSVLINRSVEDVFQYVADFENYPNWNPLNIASLLLPLQIEQPTKSSHALIISNLI